MFHEQEMKERANDENKRLQEGLLIDSVQEFTYWSNWILSKTLDSCSFAYKWGKFQPLQTSVAIKINLRKQLNKIKKKLSSFLLIFPRRKILRHDIDKLSLPHPHKKGYFLFCLFIVGSEQRRKKKEN